MTEEHESPQDGTPRGESPDALEELDRLIRERHSKLDQRVAKAEKRAEAAEAEVAQLRKGLEEGDLGFAKDDPELLELIRDDRRVREHGAQVKQREAQVQDREAKQAEVQRKQDAQEIANEYGVDVTLLLSLTDGSRENMETLARVLPQKRPEEPRPDSGITVGGGGTPTVEQLEDMPMDSYAEYYRKRKEAEAE